MTLLSPTYSPAQPNCPSARLMPNPSTAYCRKSPDGLTRQPADPPSRARPPPGGEHLATTEQADPAGAPICPQLWLTIWLTILPGGRFPIAPILLSASPKGYSTVSFPASARQPGRIPGRASLPSRAAGGARPGGRAALALQALGIAGAGVDSPGRI